MAIAVITQAVKDYTEEIEFDQPGWEDTLLNKLDAERFFTGGDWHSGADEEGLSTYHLWLDILGIDSGTNRPEPETLARLIEANNVMGRIRNWKRRDAPENSE